jgi:hypothetical protein
MTVPGKGLRAVVKHLAAIANRNLRERVSGFPQDGELFFQTLFFAFSPTKRLSPY